MHVVPAAPPTPTDPSPREDGAGWPLGCAQILVMVCFLAPLIVGDKTLFFRDVGNFHWPVKLEQSRSWAAGETPHVDLWRGGGQPGLGNPNTTPLYPSNVLLLGATPGHVLWGFNAHFWLHLLLAPILIAGWLRALGLRGQAPWVGAATFVGSGFVLSTFGFHNLVAYTTWIPALLWSTTSAVTARTPRRAALATASVSLSWAMLLLAGDPTSAVIGGLAAFGSITFLDRTTWSRALWPLLALLPGFLLAWPQIAALLGTLDGSMRGALGYSAEGVLRGSWHPALGLDLLFPFALGFPDGSFWGARFHGGAQPLLFTFFPGAAALVLCAWGATTSDRSRLRGFGVALLAAGALTALGGFNPVIAALARAGGMSWLRFPVKAWWWVALGVALLAALAVDRAGRCESARSRLSRVARAGGVAWLAAALLFLAASVASPGWLVRWIDHPLAAQVVETGLRRQTVTAALGVLSLLTLGWTLRRPTTSRWASWVAVFAAVQFASLQPLLPTLDVEDVVRPMEAFAELPEDALLVHGPLDLGWPAPAADAADRLESAADQQRRLNRLGVPMVGVASGGRYLLNTSPDGLDSYLPGAVRQLLRRVPRVEQMRVLPRLGATHVVTPRRDGPVEVVALDVSGGPVFSARWARSMGIGDTLARLAADAASVTSQSRGVHGDSGEPGSGSERGDELIVVADDLGEALGELASAEGESPATRARWSVEVIEDGPSGTNIQVETDTDGWLMLDRAWLPRYRAAVDGVSVRTSVANALRLAVPVPAGSHRVEVVYDTRSWDERRRFLGFGIVSLFLVAFLRLRRG